MAAPERIKPIHQNGILVWVNERGLRVGEDHQRAKLTDQQVEEIRDMREQEGLLPRAIMKRLKRLEVEVSMSTIKKICLYQRRTSVGVEVRRVAASRSVSK